jgi:hypothetical protein
MAHIEAAGRRLREGDFGKPLEVSAHSFVSRIEAGAEEQGLWELDASVAGGGALMHLGVHVLSMLDAVVGPVVPTRTTLAVPPGRATEDGALIELEAGGVPGTLAVAWHVPGYMQADNTVRVRTDRGLLVLTLSVAAFLPDEGDPEIVHVMDEESGFDLAPMDGGRGLWLEQRAIVQRVESANTLALASRVEGCVRAAYAVGAPASQADDGVAREQASASADDDVPPLVLVDLRGAPAGVVRGLGQTGISCDVVARVASDRPASHLTARPGSVVCGPDVLSLFRTMTNRGARALVAELGTGNLARAALRVRPHGAAAPASRTWEVLRVLLRAELGRLDASFAGSFLVDAYLVDLSTAADRPDVLVRALADVRRALPRARVGLETNAPRRLAPYLARLAGEVDVVMALGSPAGNAIDHLLAVPAEPPRLLVKTGTLPAELLALAWREPERWSRGGARVVVDWPGVPQLAARKAADVAVAVAAASGGDRPG